MRLPRGDDELAGTLDRATEATTVGPPSRPWPAPTECNCAGGARLAPGHRLFDANPRQLSADSFMRVTDKQQPPARKPPVPTRACIVEGARPLLEPLAVAAESNQDDGPWGKGLSRSLLNFASGGLPVSL